MKNFANYISLSRIILSFIMLLLKSFTFSFYIVYIICGITDMLDGFIARKFKIESKTGERIDSISDIIFLLVSAIKIFPYLKLSTLIIVWIMIIILIRISNILYVYTFSRRVTFFHTKANKLTGLVLFIIPLVIGYVCSKVLIFLACLLATFSSLQESFYIKTKVMNLEKNESIEKIK